MLRTGNTKRNPRHQIQSATSGLTRRPTVLVVISLLALGLAALLPRTGVVSSRAAVTVEAAGRGEPYFHFKNGREMQVAYRGDERLMTALRSGGAQPRALASIDFDRNGTPDVVAGYSYNGAGILTVHHGNPDAFAPQDESVYARFREGYNPDSLLPVADVYAVPEAAQRLLEPR